MKRKNSQRDILFSVWVFLWVQLSFCARNHSTWRLSWWNYPTSRTVRFLGWKLNVWVQPVLWDHTWPAQRSGESVNHLLQPCDVPGCSGLNGWDLNIWRFLQEAGDVTLMCRLLIVMQHFNSQDLKLDMSFSSVQDEEEVMNLRQMLYKFYYSATGQQHSCPL